MLVRSRELRWRGKSGGQQGNWRTLRVQVRVVVKIFGRVVGCGTGLARFDEDRGAPLEGVRGFYGKIHLGEPIRITGQGVAYVARYPTASVGSGGVPFQLASARELLRIVLHGQGTVHGVAAAKGWW